jgi:small subunit ribosomal protein S20
VANSAQARKRARTSEVRRQNNMGRRSMMRTYLKKVISAIRSGNKDEAQTAYNAAMPVVDKMAGEGIIHKNKAARHKQRLNAHIRAMA